MRLCSWLASLCQQFAGGAERDHSLWCLTIFARLVRFHSSYGNTFRSNHRIQRFLATRC